MTEKLLLTVREAAELSGVSDDTILRWISKGVNGRKLKRVPTGITRIRRKSLDEFFDAIEKAS